MKPEISILIPTRNRPEWVHRLIRSVNDTSAMPVEMIFYQDDDDPARHATETLAEEFDDPENGLSVVVLTGPRVVLSECWNRCAESSRADILMQCADDIVFKTQRWDERVIIEFDLVPDKIIFVHGRDGIQDERLGTHGFLHRRWMETVGYFVPPLFASDYNDLWLTEIADALGRRRYVQEIYTEHMHPVAGKAPLDLTHQERLARHQAEDCDAIWRNTADRRQQDMMKLREAINSYRLETENV